MMAFLLVAVGLGLYLALLAATVAGLLTRRRFARQPGTFRCNVRVRDCGPRAVSRRWSRVSTWALWTHDVLMIHRGVLRPRVLVFPVRFPDGQMVQAIAEEIAGLGLDPLLFVLRCDDETLIEIAASGVDRTLLAGPFLAAAIPGLPRAPTERR